jgi:putative SOS response-associated peptidase YedK
MKWGIDIGRMDTLLFNSRSDAINIYPFYKKYKRCVIIIDGYYEWKKINKGGNKIFRQPYYISLKEKDENNLIYLAGLYSDEIDEEGFEYKSASIITCNANKQIEDIHDRMPLIFQDFGEAEKYLNGYNLSYFLKKAKELTFEFWQIGDLVNDFKNTSKDNILPLDQIKYNKKGNLLINHFFNKSNSEISLTSVKKNKQIENRKKEMKINKIDEINKRANSFQKINIKENDDISEISTITGITNDESGIKKNNKKGELIFKKGLIKPKNIKNKSKNKNNIQDKKNSKTKTSNNKQINFMKNFLNIDA